MVSMFSGNYPIQALDILLVRDCLMDRYHPLIPYKEALIADLSALGCRTRDDVSRLKDRELLSAGLPDEKDVRLFRRFLCIYDPDPKKFREISKFKVSAHKQAALTELYHLPGVRYVRASLYYSSGYHSLKEIASSTAEEILARTAKAIDEQGLSYIVPTPKEVRTHIAVARAFILSSAE